MTSIAQDACNLRISLLTCSPGNELYSTFGHTAVRVQDASTGNDLIFNYGTFDFNSEFYVKFIRGQLLYFLSVQDFDSFIYQYQTESRSVVEQQLNLSCLQKQKLFYALKQNALEQNKYYRYDFLFDNCTTRAKDIIKQNAGARVLFRNILPSNAPTFRDLIHSYLNAAGQHWSKLGIDLLLGAKLDRKVTNEQAMFLPDYLMKGLDNATMQNQPVVQSKQTILQMPSPITSSSVLTPFIVFLALFLLIAAATFFGGGATLSAMRFFDFVLFSVLGIIGFLLLFMWFGTDHNVTQSNYNLLWALPSHLIIAFFLLRRRAWVRRYFQISFLLGVILLVFWFFLPQEMNNGFIPIIFIVILRSWQLSRIKYATENN